MFLIPRESWYGIVFEVHILKISWSLYIYVYKKAIVKSNTNLQCTCIIRIVKVCCYEFYVCLIETMVHVDVIGHQGRLVLGYHGLVNCHIFQRTLIGTISGIAYFNI